MSEVRKKKKKSNPRKTILAVLVILAVIIASVLLVTQIIRQEKKNAELRLRKERLEQLIEQENERREGLKDEEQYVRTQKYIEEKAKSIGYIFPDEIVFREDD